MISDYIIRFENDGGCPVERAASSLFCARQATGSNHGSICPIPNRQSSISEHTLRPLHGDWRIFCLLIHCIIGSYFVYLSIKNSIIFLPWHTNPRIPMSM
ncbi:hypothetical protein CS546_10970 [Porphyromonas gingivalis]|nr:hypothetical protein CS546_10970 [Porphyromonas gingivalis]ATR96688.1 hypothetical protein CS548_06170 [Porphyromonas gingivalis]